MARPRSFDHDDVVDRAMQRVWREGPAATSPADLAEATGLNRSSLYNAFGSKEGVVLAALERYEHEETARLYRELGGPGSPLARLRGALRLVVASAAADDEGRGCLVTTTAVEGGSPAVRERVAVVLRAQRAAFADVVRRARDAGEVPADVDPDAAASVLLAAINGVRATARAGIRPDDPDAVVDVLLGGVAPGAGR
jgi:TetR/AcrR family transcriptional repressor of nem operon